MNAIPGTTATNRNAARNAAVDVLIVEDTTSFAAAYLQYLKDEPWRIQRVATLADAREKMAAFDPPAVILDLELPDGNGLDLLKECHARNSDSRIIVATVHSAADIAADAMKFGAHDFLTKPFSRERLTVTLRNALDHKSLEDRVKRIEDGLEDETPAPFVGHSPQMRALYRMLEAAASSAAPVFIEGESGTGKELCARAIHDQGPRRHNRFVALNCAAVPRDLIESELFGHVKGAFTGATADRKGAATLADGGTLLLDEICEMDADLQAKLLRFSQLGDVQPVGSDTVATVDVRIVCATNRNPLAEMKAGRFREDLYYRLHVIPIVAPPLRERTGDVARLAYHFLHRYSKEENKRFTGIDDTALAVLSRAPWPGNVRQLENVIRSIVVMNDDEILTADMLPADMQPADMQPAGLESPTDPPEPTGGITAAVTREVDREADREADRHAGAAAGSDAVVRSGPDGRVSLPQSVGDIRPLADCEREIIETAIAVCGGNIRKAAFHLGIDPSTIYRKKQAWPK